jgi:L,D-peptidoglycan transpeptidase YkuD (ErfK/YbiS/YcfS/YnhG family)
MPSDGIVPSAAPDTIQSGALASTTAVRSPATTVGAQCDLETIEAIASRHREAGQLIVTRTSAFGVTSGFVDVAAKVDGVWRCQRGTEVAMVGRNGTRPIADRRSGDGTAPAGVFPLGTTTAWDGQTFQFFGNAADPGVRGTYRAVRAGDCWGARPNTSTYNHLYRSTVCPSPDEYLPNITGAYVHAAVIGANTEPDVSGDAPGETPYAAAIFLHRHAYTGSGEVKPTSGCVSLAIQDLVPTLALIDPALNPRFAIGPTDWLRTTA